MTCPAWGKVFIGGMITAGELFQLPKSLSAFEESFNADECPWKWLPKIEKALNKDGRFSCENLNFLQLWKNFIKIHFLSAIRIGKKICIGKNVSIGKNVKLPVTCTIGDNVFIGDYTEIRSGALIRNNVIIGEHCVIGNSCEIKNSLLMDHVQVAHFNYVGDSILGSGAHLSAGAILSNLRFDNKPVEVNSGREKIPTGLRKFGAILGEGAQVGCNSVLLPGTILGKNSIVSVGTIFGGVLEKDQIVYAPQNNVFKSMKK